MPVINQFTLPVTYEQFHQMNQQVNPTDEAPEGCLSHFVTEQNGTITVTDIWEDANKIDPFYKKVAELTGFPMPEMQRQELKKWLVK